MDLLLLREKPVSAGLPYTHGRLYITSPGKSPIFLCYTLEDEVRPRGQKVFGKTAIPAGVYNLSVTMSVRFKKLLPLLSAVPGFDGVRIHGGNDENDTDGCVLVGGMRCGDHIRNCAPYVLSIIKFIQDHPGCRIEIKNW